MGSRGGGNGKKTAEDVRFNVKIGLWDSEVDRHRYQDSIEGGSEGGKKAGASNDMRQTFGTKGAEGTGAKI